jgi:hypothetical protein
MKNNPTPRINPHACDLDDLLRPAQAFAHPRDVVADPDLTLNEKRAILASWASDACAVEAAPALRCARGSPEPVPVDSVLEALRELDKVAADTNRAAWIRRQARRQSIERFRSIRQRPRGDSRNALSH